MARWATVAVFATQGLLFASWTAHIPLVKERLSLGDADLGMALFGGPIGSLIAMLGTGWLLPRLGSRRMVQLCLIGYCATGWTVGLANSQLTLFAALVLWGAFQGSLDNTLLLIFAAIVTMYIVLGVLYESYIHPVTILSTLPSAGVGALLALMLSGNDIDIIAIIGIILLIGIVKKNAIMMIDFALAAERQEGKSPREAIRQACLLRFRPILMTTMAALLAALPLMLGTGVGSELRHPLGITMVGGLLFSQVLTLFTTPVIYLAFDRLAQRMRSRGIDPEGEVPSDPPVKPGDGAQS